MLGTLLTTLGLVGDLAQVERRVWVIELDAGLLILSYIASMYLRCTRGVGR